MKKALIYTLAILLLYSFFPELTYVKILLICLGLVCVYGTSRLSEKHVVAMKYPVILLSFAATAFFLVYPHMNVPDPVKLLIVFLSFYSITFYLITIQEKGKGLLNEAVALSVLFLSSAFNMAMTGRPVLIVAISVAVILFLFIIERSRIIPLIAVYTLIIMVLLLKKNIPILSSGTGIDDIHRYVLLCASFVLLALAFGSFIKQKRFIKGLVFFGFLYVCIDVALVLGLQCSTGLLCQPVISVFVVSPLIGFTLHAEGKRV